MKLHILSDLHLELGGFEYTPPECDVVILAGDINLGTKGLEWAKKTYGNMPIIYCGGNHEYYNQHFDSNNEAMRRIASDLGIHLLQNNTVVIGDVRFIGATLWTDFMLHGNQPIAMIDASNRMNDYRLIRGISPNRILSEHKQSFRFIDSELKIPFPGTTIVVTHHAPSEQSCYPEYKGHYLNPCFASNLEDSLLSAPAMLWIHGHIHASRDYNIGACRVLSNIRGYENEETQFNPDLVITV